MTAPSEDTKPDMKWWGRFCTHPLRDEPTKNYELAAGGRRVRSKYWWCPVCERGIALSWEPPPEKCP